MSRNPFDVLGVDKTATDDEIKKAYRKMAKELHPDRNPDNPNAEEQFKEVNNAYEQIKTADKRASFSRGPMYEDFGSSEPGYGDYGGFEGYDPFKDAHMRSRRAHWNNASQNAEQGYQQMKTNIRDNVGVPLDVFIKGGKLRIPLTIPIQRGPMIDIRSATVPIMVEPNTPIGTRVILTPLDHNIEGVNNITLILFPIPDEKGRYKLDGFNIYVQMDVDVFDSMFGNEVDVELPTGSSIRVTIPKGITSGKRIRIAKKGLTDIHGHAGDIILVVSLTMPEIDDETVDKISEIIQPESS